ncbi:MAG: DUF4160 domain-containing protein [Treponemataceae bacterium]|nr:DUF4160 domain-containing protein [Treponemataceae bacterium]
MPTVFIDGRYRFYFFSREENRRHVHVSSSDGEAKIWLEPEIEVARVVNLSAQEVSKILKIIGDRQEEINDFWNRHFK